ncbi:hypothetical protein VTK73DRAFT_3358 [Phialemonium thermophilum]|uniref:Uncharacterized protein n=1 Tax=Phialemonium thermophilum TaxID=223376 RepID=A0ABR3VKK6_9PEZI
MITKWTEPIHIITNWALGHSITLPYVLWTCFQYIAHLHQTGLPYVSTNAPGNLLQYVLQLHQTGLQVVRKAVPESRGLPASPLHQTGLHPTGIHERSNPGNPAQPGRSERRDLYPGHVTCQLNTASPDWLPAKPPLMGLGQDATAGTQLLGDSTLLVLSGTILPAPSAGWLHMDRRLPRESAIMAGPRIPRADASRLGTACGPMSTEIRRHKAYSLLHVHLGSYGMSIWVERVE